MVNNKRGWIRILEATIAVMLVAGVLVVVYSKQIDRGIEPDYYFYSLQRQILADISSRTDLRLAVLNTYDDSDVNDGNFSIIYEFVDGKVPEAFNFSLQVCEMGSSDHCKILDEVVVREIVDKDVFVEDIFISSELGDGTNRVSSSVPKKLVFFIWEKR